MATQTIQFNSVSLSEIGSGTITAFIYDGDTLTATLSTVTENATLKGQYTGTVTDEAADTYRLVVKFDGITISEPDYEVTLVLATGTYVAESAVLTDTNELQTNQGNWVTATGFSTHDAAAVVTALGTGSTLTSLATAASISALNNVSTAQIATTVSGELISYDPPTKSEMDAAFAALNDPTAASIATTVLTTQMTESYAAQGVAPTLAEAVFLIQQHLDESSISGTTKTVKKLDQSTTAATMTLDDASNPTSVTRAT